MLRHNISLSMNYVHTTFIYLAMKTQKLESKLSLCYYAIALIPSSLIPHSKRFSCVPARLISLWIPLRKQIIVTIIFRSVPQSFHVYSNISNRQ
jgi:hypothetical protein